MDIGELIVRVFHFGFSIYETERDRKRAKQRSNELKELSGKITTKTTFPALGMGNMTQKMERDDSIASEGQVEGEKQSLPQEIAEACIPCALGHFSTSSGILKEALRFKSEGMASNNILDRIATVLEEQNALEREDLTPEKIQRLPEWEKEVAEEALAQSRQLRHKLESIQTMDELEQLAADTRSYYLKLSRQWYKGRFRNLGAEKADVIAGKTGG